MSYRANPLKCCSACVFGERFHAGWCPTNAPLWRKMTEYLERAGPPRNFHEVHREYLEFVKGMEFGKNRWMERENQ